MRNQSQCLLHVLKIEEDYMRDVVRCDKKAEFRINDRDYQVGDLIHFVRVDGTEYCSYFNLFRITHILNVREIIRNQSGKVEDYVVLSIEKLEDKIPSKY